MNNKKFLSYTISAFLILLPYDALSSISVKPSPDRCMKKENGKILPVDNLLPEAHAYAEMDRDKKTASFEAMSKITSQRMLQSVIDHLYSYHDLCGEKVAGVGGWTDGIGTALCERLGAFDMTHDKMLSSGSSASKATPELKFLQTVYDACRMSTDRFWDYPSIVHNAYQPTTAERVSINKMLGHPDWTY